MAKAAGALAVNNRIQVSDAAKEKSRGQSGKPAGRRAQIKRGDARSDSPQRLAAAPLTRSAKGKRSTRKPRAKTGGK